MLSIGTADAADGVQSVRKHICSCGPIRCAPLQPHVRFEMPGGGLRLRGDIEVRLMATGGVLADERLGWLTLHTSFMHQSLLPLPDGGAIRREDIDGISSDARFPADWRMAFEYALADAEGVGKGVTEALPIDLVHG